MERILFDCDNTWGLKLKEIDNGKVLFSSVKIREFIFLALPFRFFKLVSSPFPKDP
jgi:hypothetical protein